MFSIEKVSDELVGRGDDLTTWAKQRDAMFLKPDDGVVESLRAVSAWAARSVADGRYKEAALRAFLQEADYYLIAHARAHGHVVVTHEIPGTSTREIKIPDACIGLGIKCMSPFGPALLLCQWPTKSPRLWPTKSPRLSDCFGLIPRVDAECPHP